MPQKTSLSYDGTFRIFSQQMYTESQTSNQIARIIQQQIGTEKFYGNSTSATKIAKSLDSIILSDEQINYNEQIGIKPEVSKKQALDLYNSLSGGTNFTDYDTMVASLQSNSGNILAYYEYYQFKKAQFRCSNIGYDQRFGKVNLIEFEFTGKIE